MATPADTLRDAALDLLWRQWRTVGATADAPGEARAIVDPEALVLMSLAMQAHERRLVDVTGAWVQRNASLLSIQRLRNLAGGFPAPVPTSLAALARVAVEQAKDLRWRSLLDPGAPPLGMRDGRLRSLEAPLGRWQAVVLQLRRGIGVGVKADALAFLLGAHLEAEWWSVAAIASATGYTPAAVRRAADDLAAARFVRAPATAARVRGTQRLYGIDLAHWKALLGVSAEHPGWGYWPERFAFVLDVLAWSDRRIADAPASQVAEPAIARHAENIEARALLERHEAALLHDRVAATDDLLRAPRDLALLERVIEALASWLRNRA